MKWLLKNNFPSDVHIFANAALNGNLDNMKWLFENQFPKNYCFESKSFRSDDSKKYEGYNFKTNYNFIKNNDTLSSPGEINYPYDKWTFPYGECTFKNAIKNGNLDNIKWLFENNFPYDILTFAYAAEKGNLDNMKWLLENNFPYNEYTFVCAVKNGNLDNIKWLLENKFPYSETIKSKLIELGLLEK